MLTHIEFENYRIFKKRQVLDIKPITILFGKNNAGKSAVLKLPFIGKSIYDAKDSNTFSTKINEVEICKSYRDLVYGRGFQSVYLKFVGNAGNQSDILFHIDMEMPVFEKKEHLIKEERSNTIVDYIGPFRIVPNSYMSIDTQMSLISGKRGTNTYQALIRDAKTTSHILCNKVSQWYQDNFEGWGVYVDYSSTSTGEVYNVVMRCNGITTPIWDCGTGIIQSLPVVIRACQPAENPTLVVFEEPESHLNPAAHAELCQLIVDSTEEDENKRYMIETHSHTFILRLQRLLAEGKLNPDNVALYYVKYNEVERSSQLERIEMMQDGSIPQWPKGMFQDVMKELMVINNARFGS